MYGILKMQEQFLRYIQDVWYAGFAGAKIGAQKWPVHLSSALASRAMGSFTVRINQLRLIRRSRHSSTLSFNLAISALPLLSFLK